MTAQPEATMESVARFCGLLASKEQPEASDTTIRLDLPTGDSQNKSGLSRQKLANFAKDLTEKEVQNIDRVLRACGLPDCEAFPIDAESMHAIIYADGFMANGAS